MTLLAGAAVVLLLGGGGLQTGADAAVRDVRSRAPSGEVLDVPFLSQDRLLCGGAAAAMVERFWGRRGVYSNAYADLVRPSEGGIRTTELARAVESRGYRVEVVAGKPAAGRRAVDRGVPAILLIEADPERYHYVVLVGWSDGSAVVHDPLRGPDRYVDEAELEKMHAGTDHWTMVFEPATRPSTSPAGAPPSVRSSEALDADGPGQGAAEASVEAAWESVPALDSALAAIRAGEFGAAERWARPAASVGDPAVEAVAWQIVATARYRMGRPYDALEAWNRRGEPAVDLVVLEGVRLHRWPVLAEHIPVRHGEVLTAEALRLAERRLMALPGIESARMEYRPLARGGVEVRGFVVEDARWPSRLDLVGGAAGAVVDEEIVVEGGPWLTGAERGSVRARWSEASALARVELSAPAPPLPGVATVTLGWGRERFGGTEGEASTEEWRSAALGVRSWVASDVRLGLRLAAERWIDGRDRIALGGSVLHVAHPDRLGVRVDGTGWTGDGAFGRVRVRVRGRVPASQGEWRGRGAGAWASAEAPRAVWEGAGLGRVRDPLLRGRRLVEDGAVTGPVFGPRMLQASLERAFLWRVGPARAGFALFGDVARAWGGDARSRWIASWGGQAEVQVAGRRFAVSVGSGSGDWVLSTRVRSVETLF